jgi:hypothetical protein
MSIFLLTQAQIAHAAKAVNIGIQADRLYCQRNPSCIYGARPMSQKEVQALVGDLAPGVRWPTHLRFVMLTKRSDSAYHFFDKVRDAAICGTTPDQLYAPGHWREPPYLDPRPVGHWAAPKPRWATEPVYVDTVALVGGGVQ